MLRNKGIFTKEKCNDSEACRNRVQNKDATEGTSGAGAVPSKKRKVRAVRDEYRNFKINGRTSIMSNVPQGANPLCLICKQVLPGFK